MFSHRITKITGVALAASAVAAPTASAMPIGGIPNQARPAAAKASPLAQATYSRQDKQMVPNSPTPAAVPSKPTVVSSTPNGGLDWAYVGIGAGGAAVLTIVGLGGALAIQRRSRKPAVASTSVATS